MLWSGARPGLVHQNLFSWTALRLPLILAMCWELLGGHLAPAGMAFTGPSSGVGVHYSAMVSDILPMPILECGQQCHHQK